MSITVRTWSKEDLERIKEGKDRELITIFLNVKTFSKEEAAAYPYHLSKTYHAVLAEQAEPIEFFATDDETAKWFLRNEYDDKYFGLREKMITYREVIL